MENEGTGGEGKLFVNLWTLAEMFKSNLTRVTTHRA